VSVPAGPRIALWLLLALPAACLLRELYDDAVLAMDLLRPSGEMAVRLMVLALLPGPLAEVFGPNRLLRTWLAIRRNLGVAACGYALLHLVIYFIDMGRLAAVLDELALPGIWTGWLALLLMALPAAISTDRAMRALGRRWQRIQRCVYPALLLTFVHWLLLDHEWSAAAVHAAPLMIAWSLRALHRLRRRQPEWKLP
jgi:sulfoxide reductase heme-binding subunit YedZ